MDFARLSPLPIENLYHIGVVVDDIDRGMAEVAAQMGVTWAPRRVASVSVREGPGVRAYALDVVYSRQGPPFLELIEGSGRGVWSAGGGPRLHHLGVFVDDLAAEAARLESLGMVTEAAGVGSDPDDPSPALFAYLLGSTGVRIELVDGKGRDGLLQWVRS